MDKGLKNIALVLLLFSAFPLITVKAERVFVYADALERDYGKSWRREGIKTVPFSTFFASRTIATMEPDGVLTAVLVDARIEQALRLFLEGFQERWIEPVWIWKEARRNRTVYSYYDPSLQLHISFSLEKPSERILALIENTYRRDRRTRQEVQEIYQRNYVLRIHAAENVFEPWIDILTFDEILVAATLVGNSFQPLFGIHDGRGLLQSLPDLVEAERNITLVKGSRPIQMNKPEYLSFMVRVHRLPGDFVRNLWRESKELIEIGHLGIFQLPEELIVRRRGEPEEQVLLWYDVLTRIGYETILVAVRRTVREQPTLMVLYRTRGRGNWGLLSFEKVAPEVAANWKEVPSRVFGGETILARLDASTIFRTERIEYPEPADWIRY